MDTRTTYTSQTPNGHGYTLIQYPDGVKHLLWHAHGGVGSICVPLRKEADLHAIKISLHYDGVLPPNVTAC